MPIEFEGPRELLDQGDVFAGVPSVTVKDLDHMIKLDAEGRYRLQDWQPPSHNVTLEHQANARAVRHLAMVLTHGCEIDKTTRKAVILSALIRPMTGVQERDRDGIRANTRPRLLYLPPNEFFDGENYVDLRRITTFARPVLDDLERVASMSADGQSILQAQLFRFFTRRLPPDEWLTWEEERDGA